MWTLVSSSARVYISRDLFNAPKSVIDVDNRARFITKSCVCETSQSSVDNMFVSELNSTSKGTSHEYVPRTL